MPLIYKIIQTFLLKDLRLQILMQTSQVTKSRSRSALSMNKKSKFSLLNNVSTLIANLSSVRSNLWKEGGLKILTLLEPTDIAKFQILQQAAVAILSQANDIKSPILGLIQDKNTR